MGYEIIRYRDEFRDQVIGLMKNHWGPDEATNAACFKWKYEDNPYLDGPLLYLALDGKRLAGMRGLFGAAWQIGARGTGFPLPCNADTYVEPADRRHGVYHQLTKRMIADLSALGISHVLNFTPSEANALNSMLFGWRPLGPFRSMTRHRSEDDPGGPDPVSPPGTPEGRDEIVIDTTARPQEMASLIARCTADGRIGHVRNEAYFGWRYGNPFSNFRFVYCRSRELDGYLILYQAADRQTDQLWIADIAAPSKAIEAKLLNAAIGFGDRNRLRVWSATLSDETRRSFLRLGFRPDNSSAERLRYATGPLIRAMNHGGADGEWDLGGVDLRRLANWDLRRIYNDAM